MNTLYQVQAGGKEFYAAIEYAPPLKTLRSMSEHKEAGLSKEERNYQAALFYETIKDIIFNHADPPEIKDRIVFIYLEEGMSIAEEIYKTLLSGSNP